MTEGEAKEKWCPFARYEQRSHDVAGYNTTTVNRTWSGGTLDMKAARCIGSQCMAWKVLIKMGDVEEHGHCSLMDQNI